MMRFWRDGPLVRKPLSAEQIRTVSSQALFHRGSRTTGYSDIAAA